MPKVIVTEHDVSARKTMRDRIVTNLQPKEVFRQEINLHIPTQSRKLVVRVYRSDTSRVSRLPILKPKLDFPSDVEASFEAHINAPEVHITILHWLNATFVVASGTYVKPSELAQMFEKCIRTKVDELPAFFFVGDQKKNIRSQRISTIPSAVRQPEMA